MIRREAEVIARRGPPDLPASGDFGGILLRDASASGYMRVDWSTHDGLPACGGGRFFLPEAEGTRLAMEAQAATRSGEAA